MSLSRFDAIPIFGLAAALAIGLFASAGAMRPEPPERAPEITADVWINSEPLSAETLRGQVVLVEFWTFACWNCKNVEPYVKRWHDRFASEGLRVIAIHTPELSFERDLERVRRYVEESGIGYPVAVDNDFASWRRFGAWAWPTVYLVGRDGRIRHVRVGEGGYAQTEAMIETLLAEPAPGS